MNERKAREDLGKVKTCIQRRDFPRAIYLFCLALREAGNQAAPTTLRGDYRTALTDICADPVYKKYYNQPVQYQPGKERELLTFFNKLYNQIIGSEDKEDYETTLQRKLNLDRCISDGKAFLNQGKISEADACFIEGLKYYRNEIAAFGMMAKALMDVNQYVRAMGYLKKGLKEKPEDADLMRMLEECENMRK